MKRPVMKLLIAVALVSLVSACTIVVETPVRTPDATVTAGLEPDTRALQVTLAAGESYLVRVNPGSTGRDVLYIELNRDIDLEVFGPSRLRIASASSRNFFGTGGTGLTTASVEDTSLDSQGLIAVTACRGSCVIQRLGSSAPSHYFALITNTNSSSTTVDFYAFGDQYYDEFEAGNNVPTTTAFVSMTEAGESGAIETLGDVDWWRVIGSGSIEFVAASPDMEFVFDIFAENGTTLEDGGLRDGDIAEVFNNELIRVRVVNNRAGSAAASQYHFINNP